MSKQDSIFLTQGLASSQIRRQAVQTFVNESQSGEVTEITAKTLELFSAIQELRPHDGVIQYRQMKRQLKQARIVAQSQLSKIEKCTLIDIQFARKCVSNQPLPDFEGILKMLQKEQNDSKQLLQQFVALEERVGLIQEEIG